MGSLSRPAGRGSDTALPRDDSAVKRPQVLSTLAVQGALPALVARYEWATGTGVVVYFEPTNGLLARIAAGEAADIAILTRAAVDDLGGQGCPDPL